MQCVFKMRMTCLTNWRVIDEEELLIRGSFSVLVLRGVILVSGLDAVMTVAEALPVALIPEENTVSSVRLDVIHIGRLDVASLLQALHTQRICLKVTLAGSVPCRSVASAACGACLLRVEGTVLFTVLRTVGNECCTAGMPARCVRSAWHDLCLLSVLVFGKGRSVPQGESVFVVGLNNAPHILSWERRFW